MSPLHRADRQDAGPRALSVPGPAALDDPDPAVRRSAVRAAGDDAVPDLLARFGVETDPAVREALVSRFVGLDRADVVDALLPHLAHPDAAVRSAVVTVLSRTPDATLRRLPALLADDDPDVRVLAVMVLAGVDRPDVDGRLLDVLRTDPHQNVVACAAGELLARSGDRHRDAVREAAERFPHDPFLAFAAGRTDVTVLS